MTKPIEYGPSYHLCGPLEAGTYRFVYWGLPDADEARDEEQPALGVQFSVTGD